jgi:proton-translocating NADH-quinone oxidoreductase chain M
MFFLKLNFLKLLINNLFFLNIIIYLWPNYNKKYFKKISLVFSFFLFFISLFLLFKFKSSTIKFQHIINLFWLNQFNINYIFGIDGLSIFLILLTTLLFFICLLNNWNSIKFELKKYLICFFIIELFLIYVFSILDIFLFYIFFEIILIPMFLIIGIWGSRERKIQANYLFFLYTLLGSLFMFLGIIYIYIKITVSNYEILTSIYFSYFEQKFLWLFFFFSFAIKIPLFPMHIWLPEAHVEAPTSGSVILAGILLKLGVYGFLRFSLPLFKEANYYFVPFIFLISVLGIIFSSFIAIRQTDLKKIIAYSSVAHMNLIVIGMFSYTFLGIEGSLIQSLSHGFISSALFLCIGFLYDRYHTKIIKYYSGLIQIMPLILVIFLFFIMSNISLPGTSSFIGEFLILSGLYKYNIVIAFFSTTGMVLGSIYSLWLFNKISYGNLKIQFIGNKFLDIKKNEFLLILPLILFTLIMGLYPEFFLEIIHISLFNLLQ